MPKCQVPPIQQLIYLEADQVIKQIRHLSYEQFSNEVKNDESFIKLEEWTSRIK
ncbi:hypothetical protein [Spiroplasma endosymbiont of Lariophagus distinguendus]|uniref:hypothetical protein n=1 Tax=Spiroplasma endosymbiont of Lariophagus distinguendus TaxID=2935082 RepID=UPI00207A1755|nr:hypothetical protein [Spiroplasma endosymbiont of Lariophagus distinguendus]